MASTVCTLSKRINIEGESEIKLRVYLTRSNIQRVGSSIFIPPKRWNKNNEIQIPNIDGKEREVLINKKKQLNDLLMSLEKDITLHPQKPALNKEWVENYINHFFESYEKEVGDVKKEDAVKNNDHLQLFTEMLTVMEVYKNTHKLSESRKKHFKTLMRSIMRYELWQKERGKKKYKLYLEELKPSDLEAIQQFLGIEREIQKKYPKIYEKIPYYVKDETKTPKLRGQKKETLEKRKPKERGQNYVADLMIRLRSFIIWVNKQKITSNNPFDNFEVKEPVYGTPIYITIEERDKLYHTDLSKNPALEAQRDIFIFHCMIGCRVSDLIKFTYDNIENDVLRYIASKTRDGRPVTVEVPLTNKAKAIIKKYENNSRSSLLPFISPQKYNDAIKEAFTLAGLTRKVLMLDPITREGISIPLNEIASSHMARRTFIGNIYKQVKDPNIVGALSGHKEGSRAFTRYRDIDLDIKKEIINIVE